MQSYVQPTKRNVHGKRLGSSTQTFHKSPLRILTRGDCFCINIRRSLISPPRNLSIFRDVRNRSRATTILESEYSFPSNLIPIFLRIVIILRLFVFWECRLYPQTIQRDLLPPYTWTQLSGYHLGKDLHFPAEPLYLYEGSLAEVRRTDRPPNSPSLSHES